jgi:hypothetical protein
MKRTLVQFDAATHQRLRTEAFRQHRSMASLVRELVAKGLGEAPAPRRPRHARQLSSVAAGRSTQRRGTPVSERHDEALAAAFEE